MIPAKCKPRIHITEPEMWARYGWMVESVAARHGVNVDDLLGRARNPLLVRARDALCGSLHGSGVGYADIGRLLDRDHTTIMDAVRRDLGRTREAA